MIARLRPLLLALVVTFAVLGCESSDQAFVRDFLISWGADKARNDTAATLGGLFGVHGGNEITAALDAVATVDLINKADKLAEEGYRHDDPAKLEQAIKLRPRDSSYRMSLYVMALDKGELAKAQQVLSQMPSEVSQPGGERELLRLHRQLISQMASMGHLAGAQFRFKSRAHCRAVYQALLQASEVTGVDVAGGPTDEEVRDWRAGLAQCDKWYRQ